MYQTTYVLTLRCDYHAGHGDAPSASFPASSIARAHRSAREAGWRIYQQQHRAKCPECVERTVRPFVTP